MLFVKPFTISFWTYIQHLYNNYNNIIKARSFSNNLRPYDDHELMYDAGSNADYSDSDDEEVELYVGNLSYCK